VSCPASKWKSSIWIYLNRSCQWLVVATMLASVYGCNKSIQNTLAPDPKLADPATVATTTPAPTASDQSLPPDFPLYPQAKLQSTDRDKERGIITNWTTPDTIDLVYAFYQKELAAKQWQIVTQPSGSEPQLVAKQDLANVKIAPTPNQTNQDKPQPGVTSFAIELLTANSPPESTQPTSSTSPAPSPAVKNSPPPAAALKENRNYLTDLVRLGVLSNPDTTTKNNLPATSRTVTRREYARWLIAAYNKIESTKPTQQIRLAAADVKPAFQDVPTTHPDFPSIQGLAEAGIIPSPLSGDATNVRFQPDLPLTREQLILWKVPLDSRQPLPAASLDAVKQTWGFQDAGKVEPKALRAVLADFQNGEQSNIRRVFGYTTLFQPKKTVNLGEVAATIWYFGANSEGLSAADVK
jgi:S-layer homology domain